MMKAVLELNLLDIVIIGADEHDIEKLDWTREHTVDVTLINNHTKETGTITFPATMCRRISVKA